MEVFLSTNGNHCLGERVVRVSNVHLQDVPQDVYCVLAGAGRYLQHYLGQRRGGANSLIVVYLAVERRSVDIHFLGLRLDNPRG